VRAYAALNAGGTAVSIHLGWRFYGAGFLVASAVVALTSFAMVNRAVGGLEYEVFRKALREQATAGAERKEAA